MEQPAIDGIKSIVKEIYGISNSNVRMLSSGFNTVSYLVEDGDKKYTLKISEFTEDRFKNVTKDIHISHYLNDILPTPLYLKVDHQTFAAVKEQKIIRMSEFLEGFPFNLHEDPLELVIEVLQKLHSAKLPFFDLPQYPDAKSKVLLHGDIIPPNILVSMNAISGVFDFERSLVGPLELDLAIFSLHFSFPLLKKEKASFPDSVKKIVSMYGGGASEKLVFGFLASELESNIGHLYEIEHSYDDKKFWDSQISYLTEKKEEIDSELRKL